MTKIKYRNMINNIALKLRLSGNTISKLRSTGGQSASAMIIGQYRAYKYSKMLMLLAVLIFCLIFFAVDIALGPYDLDFIKVYQLIFSRLFDWDQDMTTPMLVVWNLRMPRVLEALIAGIGLAMAGAAMQSMMKNPLADPYTTGISSGAALGATLAIIMGITLIPGGLGTVFNAFVFALLPAGFIILLSTVRKPSPAMIILSGISLMYIFNAVQSYIMLIANPDAAAAVYTWTVGSLNTAKWANIPYLLEFSLIGGIVLMYTARVLNTMNSGDAYAKSIGINVERARIIVLVTISLIAAGIVSFTGVIGFIGLVGPHIARMFVGSDNKILIPAAGLMGAAVMLLADSLVQIVGTNVPIGVVTSLLGGPVFMFLILRQKKEVW